MLLSIDSLNLSSTILAILAAIGGGMLSFLFGIIMERYRNRRLNITYELISTSIGQATKSDLWGDVRLFHNEVEMDRLYLFTIRIINISNFDTDCVPVNIYCDQKSSILSHNSFNSDTNTGIILDQLFYNGMVNNHSNVNDFRTQNGEEHPLSKDLNDLRSYYERNRNFNINVFNRKATCEFNLLVGSSTPETTSEIFFNIPKKSVHLSQSKNKQETDESIGKWSLSLGALITVIFGVFLFVLEANTTTSIITLTAVGCSSFLLGFLIFRVFIFIRSFFK